MNKFLSDVKSFSSVHLRAIANDLSSDMIFSHIYSDNFIVNFPKDEPFSDDDPDDYIDDDSEIVETLPDEEALLNSMSKTSEIKDAVEEINQKILQTSKKITNMQNPIKVLVKKISQIIHFYLDFYYHFILIFIII